MSSDQLLFNTAGQRTDGAQGVNQILLLIAVCAVGLFLASVVAMGLLKEMGVLSIAAIGALVTWRYPNLAAGFLLFFTPINRFLIFVAFRFHHSILLLHGSQLWKDGIIAVLLVRVIYDALNRRQAPRLQMMDLLVASFLALNLMYVVYPGTLDDTSFIGRLLGFRLDAFFLLAYFVGRGLTLTRQQVKWIMLGLLPGSIAVALVAAFQWVFTDTANALWDRLGFQAFVDAVGGSSEEAVRYRDIGGIRMPRASSLLMGDLALAFYQLLLVPIAAALYFVFRRGAGQWLAFGFLLLMLGTMALSGARSAMVVAPLALGVMTFWSVSWGRSLFAGTTFLLAGILGLIILTGGIQSSWFSGLASPDEGSTVAHSSALERGIEVVQDEPLGRGLGTSHTVGYQLGVRESFATESWYLQIASETGILSAFLYTLMMIGAIIGPLVAYQQVRDPWLRSLTLGMGGAAVGFTIVGLVLHVWEAPVIAGAFWLLLGIAIRAPELERDWEATQLESGVAS
jgi:hypothetical protein